MNINLFTVKGIKKVILTDLLNLEILYSLPYCLFEMIP